jgi:hypothetical protein
VPGAPLDRAAVERVLARAAELQVQATTGDGGGDTISEAQLLEIGKEVGIAPAVLRQAIAEERTRVVLAPEAGRVAGFAGPVQVSASRVVRHEPGAAIGALERWLTADYGLLEKRRYEGRRTWAPPHNRRPKLSRALKGNVGARAVQGAGEIGATVTSLGDGRSAVRLDADLAPQRRMAVGGGIALAGAGVVVSGVMTTIGLVLAAGPAVPLLIGLGAIPGLGLGLGGIAVARSHRQKAEQVQLGLEQLLDRLEHTSALGGAAGGALPPPPVSIDETIDQVARGVKQVAQAMSEVRRRAGI